LGDGFGDGLEIEAGAGDADVFLGVEANALFAFEEAIFAGAMVFAEIPGAFAEVREAVGAGAVEEWREFALVVGIDAQVQNLIAEAVVGLLGAVGIVFVHVVLVEPAFGGHFFGGEGNGVAEAFTFRDVETLVVIPNGIEGLLVALPGNVGAEEVSVEVGFGLGDGLIDDGLLFGGLEGRGAGDGHGGDLRGIEDFAGIPGVDGLSEQSLRDLGGDEADGVEVLHEGDGDARAGGADGETVAEVADAEFVAVHGAAFAWDSADGEGAALAAGRLLRCCFGHGFSLVTRV
jgi:hypothetical protein